MGKTTKAKSLRPAQTPEAREKQICSLAYDLAEKQILEGTASSQVITHFLKAASHREKLEQELTNTQIQLANAKVELIDTSKKSEEMYSEVIRCLKAYGGHEPEEDDDYDNYIDYDDYY